MPDETAPQTEEQREAAQQALQRLANLEDHGVSGSYANFVRVTGSPEEVVLDFCLVPNPGDRSEEKIQIQNRVVLGYFGAKRLLAALLVPGPTVQYVDHVVGEGSRLAETVAKIGPELDFTPG